MKRQEEKVQVVTFSLSRKEHEQAIKDYTEKQTTDCGSVCYVPDTKRVKSVDYLVSEAGGVDVVITYNGVTVNKEKEKTK